MSRRRSPRLAQLQSHPPPVSTVTSRTRRSRNGDPAVRLRFGGREEVRNPSCPDSRQVGDRRELEEASGGPSAPHNSVETSFIDLVDSTVQTEEDAEVFHADRFVNILTSHVRSMALSQSRASEDNVESENVEIEVETSVQTETIFINDDSDESIPGDDPVMEETQDYSFLDATVEPEVTRNHINVEVPMVDETIDLTDSPLRNTNPRNENLDVTLDTTLDTSSGTSSLNCPICLDSFKEMKKKGKQLASTICGHVFCVPCVSYCVRINGQCPTCRRRLPINGYHPIYLL